MPLVYGQDQRVADWVGAQCYGTAPTVDAAIGWESDGVLKAGVYFDAPLPNTVFAHVASVTPVFPRSLLAAVCAYAFRQLGVERMTFMVSEMNRAVLDFLFRLGARYEATLHRAFGDASAVLLVVWRDDPAPVRFMNWLDSRKELNHG